MLSLVVSTIVFFVASFLIKRRFEEMDLPKGMTRSLVMFSISMALAYAAAVAVDWIAGRV